jgi:hypothetical protein
MLRPVGAAAPKHPDGSARMRRLIKDPLLHFLAIGALLFALFAWRGEVARETARERIEISAADVAGLLDAVTILNGGRPPSESELAALIEPTIKEEVLYREAIKLGLDQNDAQVRRRLIEKMNFLTQDLAGEVAPPDDATLAAFMAEHPELLPEGEQPSLDEVRDTVLAAYLDQQRRAANEAEYQRLRAQYQIVIDMPAAAP